MVDKKSLGLSIKQDIFTLLRENLLESDADNESLCFLYCFRSEGFNTITFYPHVIIPIDKKYFNKKEKYYLQLQADILKRIYHDFIHDEYGCLIACHSHPFDTSKIPWFSSTDDRDDITQSIFYYSELLAYYQVNKKKGKREYLNLVMGQKGLNVRKYNVDTGQFEYAERVTVFFDNKIHYFFPSQERMRKKIMVDGIHSRTVDAFGPELTETMQKLRVGIVGLGGIGSMVAEGVARLGAQNMVLIDPDTVETSNLNRLQGSSAKDAGLYKVDVISRNLKKYFPKSLDIVKIKDTVYSKKAKAVLKDINILIGCVDNHPSRYFMNRFAVQYLIPYFDGATRIMPENEVISVPVRMGIVLPSITTCMDCGHIEYYTQQEVFFAFANKNTKRHLEESGYIVNNSDIKNPAVYPQNQIVSGMLILELINTVSDFKPKYASIYFDYSAIDSKKKMAFPYLKARRPGNEDGGCMNCDYYLGKADSIEIDLTN